jgi:transposase
MLRDSEFLGMKYSKFVMDKGFFTDHNVKRLAKETLNFIVSIPNSQKIPKQIILDNQGIQYDSKYSLGPGKPSAKCVTITDYGFRSNVHIFFDNIKFHQESDNLYENLETIVGSVSHIPSSLRSHLFINLH